MSKEIPTRLLGKTKPRYLSLYFKKQLEYGKTIYGGDYQEKLEEYRNFLKSDRLDIDIDKYIEFIKHITEKVNDENLLKMINNFLENGRTDG